LLLAVERRDEENRRRSEDFVGSSGSLFSARSLRISAAMCPEVTPARRPESTYSRRTHHKAVCAVLIPSFSATDSILANSEPCPCRHSATI
jgi:hypothetical protein